MSDGSSTGVHSGHTNKCVMQIDTLVTIIEIKLIELQGLLIETLKSRSKAVRSKFSYSLIRKTVIGKEKGLLNVIIKSCWI